MTVEFAQRVIKNIDDMCNCLCDACGCDWYCSSDCELLTKARKIGYKRLIEIYAKHDGNINAVANYVKRRKRV